MPKVSVLLATYNHAQFIERTIMSVLGQTFQDFEIVVVVDGSTDNTREVLDGIKDPRIHVYEMPYNQGISAASNEGLKRCAGEYIAICDSDDLYQPKKLEKQVAFLDEHREYGSVCCHASLIDEEDRPYEDKLHPYYTIFKKKNRSQAEWLKRFFFTGGNCICHPGVMTRKSAFDAVGKYNTAMQQIPDFDMVVRLIAHAPLYMLEEELVLVRVRKKAANNSAYSAEADICNQFERVELLETYNHLAPGLAEQVFADYMEGVPVEKETVPYVAARAAMDVPQVCVNYFGEKTLFRMMQDEGMRDLLKEKYGFTTKDLYALVGEHKIFDEAQIDVGRLYAADEYRFNEQMKILKPVRDFRLHGYHEFDHVFELQGDMAGTTTFRWDPSKQGVCGVRLKVIQLRDAAGSWHDAVPTKMKSNALRKVRDTYIFTTDDPIFYFESGGFGVHAVRIQAVIEYGWNFLKRQYPKLLGKVLANRTMDDMGALRYEVMELVHVETGNDITHMPAGMEFNFVSHIAAAPGEWMQVEFDPRLMEINKAVNVKDLRFSATGINGESVNVKAVVQIPADGDGTLMLCGNEEKIMLLASPDAVNITVQGVVSRFEQWGQPMEPQPGGLPGHPLNGAALWYRAGGQEQEAGTDVVLRGGTAQAIFLLPEAEGGLKFRPCSETYGAIRVVESYLIDVDGNQIPLQVQGLQQGEWNLFEGIDPPMYEVLGEVVKKQMLAVVKYDIMFGRARAVVSRLMRKHPSQAAKLALAARKK